MEINVALASKLIASQFPEWTNLPITPVEIDGWDNRTFRLGDLMSIRLPSAESYTEQVEKEQQWLPILAPLLPLRIPIPLAMGMPDDSYPWKWSIYRWLEGENATENSIADLSKFATDLSAFLNTLQQVSPTDGPPAGQHNFFRGGPLATYDAETRKAIVTLDKGIDQKAATEVWNTALSSTWKRPPVWLHGDVSESNLLIKNGQLNAVIDFGCSAVGDPACDLAIAWTLFTGSSRESFKSTIQTDESTWARGRGWALWKTLITLTDTKSSSSTKKNRAENILAEILAEYKQT